MCKGSYCAHAQVVDHVIDYQPHPQPACGGPLCVVDLREMDFCTNFFSFVCRFLALLVLASAAIDNINIPEDQCCVKVDTTTSQIIDATG